MEKILVSACLLGQKVRYDGKGFPVSLPLQEWSKKGIIRAFCPEVEGGLPVPRPVSEIREGDGHDVIAGRCRVYDIRGNDVTRYFVEGARKGADIAREQPIGIALLKARSPACGCGEIYDGSFRNRRKQGDGVFTALLKNLGIMVYNEDQLDRVINHIQQRGNNL